MRALLSRTHPRSCEVHNRTGAGVGIHTKMKHFWRTRLPTSHQCTPRYLLIIFSSHKSLPAIEKGSLQFVGVLCIMNPFDQCLKVMEYLFFTTGFLCICFASANLPVNGRVFVYPQDEYEMLNWSHISIHFSSVCNYIFFVSKYTTSNTNDHFSFPSWVCSPSVIYVRSNSMFRYLFKVGTC